MPVLKALETVYRGYRMRSRAEARWAVALDAMGVPWQYEVQGYDLGEHGRYLPDFWLPKAPAFVEIKPTPDDVDRFLMQALADASKREVWVVCPYDGAFTRSAVSVIRAQQYQPGRVVNLRAWPGFLIGPAAQAQGVQSVDLLAKGLRAARAARFEHGESGATVRKPAREIR